MKSTWINGCGMAIFMARGAISRSRRARFARAAMYAYRRATRIVSHPCEPEIARRSIRRVARTMEGGR